MPSLTSRHLASDDVQQSMGGPDVQTDLAKHRYLFGTGAKSYRNFTVIMWTLASSIACFRSELSASIDKNVSGFKGSTSKVLKAGLSIYFHYCKYCSGQARAVQAVSAWNFVP